MEDSDDTFYWGNVIIQSLGAPSDVLIETLDRLYGTCLGVRKMKAEVVCTAVGLANDPRLAATNPTRTKLSFEHENPERYGEIFFNIDAKTRWIALNEKDEDYRTAVVRALGIPSIA